MNWQVFAGVSLLIASLYRISDNLALGLALLSIGFALFFWGISRHSKNTESAKENASRHSESNATKAPDHTEAKGSPLSEQPRIKRAIKKESRPYIPPVELPLDHYIVLDIETTGFSRSDDRIIEIAANEYRNSVIINQYHTYINPMMHIPIPISRLTGITDSDVQNAPKIDEIKHDFLLFLGEAPLVGHNISIFDIPFLETQLGITISNRKYDTLTIAKRTFPGLSCYKLSYLDQALHLDGLEHHRAANDIAINNSLFLACANPNQYRPLLTKSALSKIQIEPPATIYCSVPISSITPTDPQKIKHTHLTGKTIAFTGEIVTLRKDAMQMAVDAGAILKSCVSGKLDYLVVGEQSSKNVSESGMSAKQLKALELIEAGNTRLHLIGEDEFLSLLEEIPCPESVTTV